MWRDLRYAVQALVRDPLFTGTATAALALAIATNGAIFGIVDALWFRPPGVSDSGTMVRVFASTSSEPTQPWSYPEYIDVRDHLRAFDGAAIRGRRGSLVFAADGSSELVLVNVVSTNFFETVGVAAAHGRLFAAGDERSLEAPPAIVLGHAFWQDRFGGDPSIVGQTIRIGRDEPIDVIVIGVLPPTFRDLDPASDRDLWLPTQTWARLGNGDEFQQRQNRWLDVIARLRRGVSVEAADAEATALAAGFARDYPDISAGRGARVVSDRAYRLSRGANIATALFALVALVVFITCVNLANLLIARAAGRSHEIAVRVALGAGRWRLLRQLLMESALIGSLGALGGAVVTAWVIRLAPALITAPPGMRSLVVFQTDARVLGFTALVTLLTTALFSIVPGWMVSRTDVVQLVKRSAAASGFNTRLKRVLMVAQIAISLVLVATAGVLARSFLATQGTDIGISRKPLLTIWTTFGSLTPATGAEVVRELEALPNVARVAVAIRAPLSLSGGGLARTIFVSDAHVEPSGALPRVKFGAVSSNYFEVVGTRILRGRAFTDADQRDGEPVAIVNEQFASRYFADRQAVGERIRLGGRDGFAHRIVGIAQNAVINAIGEKPEPYLYVPFWRTRPGEATFIVDGSWDGGAVTGGARAVLRRIDPRLEPRRIVALADYVRYSASIYRITAALAGALAAIGLFLTVVGVYAVVAFRTAHRTREIGIRVALGAARRQVLALVMGEGVYLALIGVAIGLPLAMMVTRTAAALLFGVSPWDPVSFGASTVLLVAVVALASFFPARQATEVEPSAALRDR